MDKRPKILYISNKKVQKAISKPVPKKIIECFYDTPLTASQIAEAVSFPKDKIYYHIKKLLSLNILYVTDTEEIKGIVQKRFLPKSNKIVFGTAPKDSNEDKPVIKKIIESQKKEVIKQDLTTKTTNDSDVKIASPLSKNVKPSISKNDYTSNDNFNRLINDRRKSRGRRKSINRRSYFERRVKQSFEYDHPNRRIGSDRRVIDERRVIKDRRIEKDRRLENDINIIRRSKVDTSFIGSKPFISSSFLFGSLAHLQGMKKAITFVHSGNTVTCMQAVMGLDDFIVKDVRDYKLPLHIDNYLIQTLPELIRHVYYQTVDAGNTKDYYLAFSSSDYNYQMVYLDAENIDRDLGKYIENNIQKSFAISKDKMILDWFAGDTIENNAVACFSSKVDSIKSDYNSLKGFGIQPRYNTSIPQIIFNIYKYSHFGIGRGNALIIYIDNSMTHLVLIQNAQLVDSQLITLGYDTFLNAIIKFFNNEEKFALGPKLSASRFLQDFGCFHDQTITRRNLLSGKDLQNAYEKLNGVLERLKSEVQSSFAYFSGVRNKISGRGLLVDNIFIGGSGSRIKNLNEVVKALLNYPVHSLDDLYLGHTKKLTLPKQQKKLVRNQNILFKQQRKASKEIVKVRDKIESTEKELRYYSDLSGLENERDKLILTKAQKIKDLKKTEKSLLLSKLGKTKLADHFKSENIRLVDEIEKIGSDLESAEKNSLEKYKKADQIAQYIKRVTNPDKSRLVNSEQSAADIEIVIRDLLKEKEGLENEITSIESDIEIANAKIVQQEKAIELNVKEHVYTSTELEQKRKQADYFFNNPWRRPKTTMSLKGVLDKDRHDFESRIKELDISLISKKIDLENYKNKKTEILKTLSPLKIKLEESSSLYDEQSSRLINVNLEYEKHLNLLRSIEDDHKKTSQTYHENLTEIDSLINRLDKSTIIETIEKYKKENISQENESKNILIKLANLKKQYELEIEYDKTEQRSLYKKRDLASSSLSNTQEKIAIAKSNLETNIKDIDIGRDEARILKHLVNSINTTHELMALRIHDDLMEVNNHDRSIETALATAEKSISWSLSQIGNQREKFHFQNSSLLKPKKRKSAHEKNEIAFVKDVIVVMDDLINTPRQLGMLKENLRSLKGIVDHKNKLLGELDDERLLIDKFRRNKDDLIKQRSNHISSIKSDEDAIKNTLKDLTEKQSSHEEIISESKNINENLESLRRINTQENDTYDAMTRSRIQKIDILEIEISDLHNLKKNREELDSEKRIEESKLVKVEKDIEDQIKQINEAKRKYEHHGDRHSNKINELKIRSKHHQENIDQLYNEISLEEEWAKESKLRLREILNEKIVWQQETKVLKDEKKALFEQISLLKSEAETKKKGLQKDYRSTIEDMESEQSAIVESSSQEKEKIKQKLFTELDALSKQEEGAQTQFRKEVKKIDTIKAELEDLEVKIKNEEIKIRKDLSDMINLSNENNDSRDTIQSEIYSLQSKLKKITEKRDRLSNQLSEKITNTGEQVSILGNRIKYKNTSDYRSFVIEGLGRIGPEFDQDTIADQMIDEAIELDTNQLSSLKESLKKFRDSSKEKLSDYGQQIKIFEKQLAPYQKKRNTLTRKIRALNKRIEILSRPLEKLKKKYQKIFDQKQRDEKNFLLYQDKIENELSIINRKRGEVEDLVSRELNAIDKNLEDELKKLKERMSEASSTYKGEIFNSDEQLNDIIKKINNRLDQIKIIITAGKEIQSKNSSEKYSIASRKKTSTESIKNYKNKIKSEQSSLKKNESNIIIEIEKHDKHRNRTKKQIGRLEDILFTLQNKREKQEESITIVNSRIEKHHGENPDIDGDISNLIHQINEIKTQSKFDQDNQKSLNKQFLIAETKKLAELESLEQQRLSEEMNLSEIKNNLELREDHLSSLNIKLKKVAKSLDETNMSHKVSSEKRIELLHQIDSLKKDEIKVRSITSSIILGLKKIKKLQKDIIPRVEKRIESVNGFIKEYLTDQKFIKNSLKELIVSQKTKISALVSVEDKIKAIEKKINSSEIYFRNNKKVIEEDYTNKKVSIEHIHSNIINLKDKLESANLRMATLSDQKRVTERAIVKSKKDFQKDYSSQKKVCSQIEKEKIDLENTLKVLKASVDDLDTRIKPMIKEKTKTDEIIRNLNLEIEESSSEINKLKMNLRDNQKSTRKADKIIASEHEKLRDEEKAIKSVIRELELKLENANTYNKDQRSLLERSINGKIDLEDKLSSKKEEKSILIKKISSSESLIIDKKKYQKLKDEENEIARELKIEEEKIAGLRENFKSINDIITELKRTFKKDIEPIENKISSSEIEIVEIKSEIRDFDKRLLELNKQIRIAPNQAKKLESLNRKYMKLRDNCELKLKETERGIHLIKKKIKILENQKTEKENQDYEISRDIDYIANIGLLLDPTETLNLLPNQHKKDFSFYLPNRLLQLGTIAFLFIATAVNILQTDQLSQKENMIPSKVKDYSVISSEKKVYEDLLNDIRILEKYKNEMNADDVNSANIITLLKYVSNMVPKEFKVTDLKINEPIKNLDLNGQSLADASLSIYLGGFVQMSSSKSKKILNKFQTKIENANKFKEININEKDDGKKSQTFYEINFML